jgi:hypothetical protein
MADFYIKIHTLYEGHKLAGPYPNYDAAEDALDNMYLDGVYLDYDESEVSECHIVEE